MDVLMPIDLAIFFLVYAGVLPRYPTTTLPSLPPWDASACHHIACTGIRVLSVQRMSEPE